MGDGIYFKFQPVEGSVPKYEYHGGTQAGWAIGSISINERTGVLIVRSEIFFLPQTLQFVSCHKGHSYNCYC